MLPRRRAAEHDGDVVRQVAAGEPHQLDRPPSPESPGRGGAGPCYDTAMAMRTLEPVELEWIERAPQTARISEHIEAPPAAVFAMFADAASWPRWFPLMTRATWLTPGPPGVGSEREVTMRGFGTFVERFVAFEPERRFAFTVFKSSSGMMSRFGEDYRLTPEGPGTRFDWIMGAEAAGIGKRLAPAMRVFMKQLLTRAARNLDKQLSGQRTTTYEKPAASSK
jgi:uncharacterized protein YndB with AHSA1/START domain